MKKLLGFALFGILAGAPCGAIDWNAIDLDKALGGGEKLVKGVVGISEKEEIEIGRDVSANLAARYGLVDNAKANRYLNLVGKAAALRSSRPSLPWHFGILNSEEINAFAAPGGYVFVTKGLLKSVKDEAQLCGVLAHEIGHVTEKHILKAIQKSNLLGGGMDLASAVSENAKKMNELSDFSVDMLMKGLGRNEELAADRVGTDLLAKVGYHPSGLLEVVKTLEAKDPGLDVMAHFEKTHPSPKERIQVIQQELTAKGWAQTSGPALANRYKESVVF